MSKSISVSFDDGTSHTYDNVPDDVTAEQINARAQQDFGDRKIANISEGAHPSAPALPATPGTNEPSLGEKALGGAITAGETIASHPWETGALLGLYKASKVANAWIDKTKMETQTARDVAAQQAETARAHQAIQQQKINLQQQRMTPNVSGPVNPDRKSTRLNSSH